MDVNKARIIRADIDAAIKAIGEKHGISLTSAKLTWDSTGFKMPIEAKEVIATATGSTLTAIAETMCKMRGYDPVKPNKFGYSIVDYKTRARSKPWVLRDKTGKEYVAPELYVERLFKADPAAAKVAQMRAEEEARSAHIAQMAKDAAAGHKYAGQF